MFSLIFLLLELEGPSELPGQAFCFIQQGERKLGSCFQAVCGALSLGMARLWVSAVLQRM